MEILCWLWMRKPHVQILACVAQNGRAGVALISRDSGELRLIRIDTKAGGTRVADVKDEIQVVTVNRQAYHEYFVDETVEAGIVLTGTEVKSIRAGHVNLRGAYARIKGDQVWLEGAHIAEYEQGTYMNHDPTAPAQVAAAPQGDHAAGDARGGEGADARAAQALLQGQSRQGGDRAVSRQEALRQARDHQGARGSARVGARPQAARAWLG